MVVVFKQGNIVLQSHKIMLYAKLLKMGLYLFQSGLEKLMIREERRRRVERKRGAGKEGRRMRGGSSPTSGLQGSFCWCWLRYFRRWL